MKKISQDAKMFITEVEKAGFETDVYFYESSANFEDEHAIYVYGNNPEELKNIEDIEILPDYEQIEIEEIRNYLGMYRIIFRN